MDLALARAFSIRLSSGLLAGIFEATYVREVQIVFVWMVVAGLVYVGNDRGVYCRTSLIQGSGFLEGFRIFKVWFLNSHTCKI